MNKALKYQDICLVPNYSSIHSRSDCSTFVVLGRSQYKLPVIPANMKAVMDIDTARWMSKNSYT